MTASGPSRFPRHRPQPASGMRHVLGVLCGGPGHDAGAAWHVGVLHSFTACSSRADLVLVRVRANAGPQAADVDRAPGQLHGIARGTREVASRPCTAGTRIRRTGSAGVDESGT
jgi:hypothetical protein